MPRLPEQTPEQLYCRSLPGGGFVAIETTRSRNVLGRTTYRGEVVVERRAARERRVGHVAPIIAERSAGTLSSVFDDLFPIAQSNVSVAAMCLDRQRGLR